MTIHIWKHCIYLTQQSLNTDLVIQSNEFEQASQRCLKWEWLQQDYLCGSEQLKAGSVRQQPPYEVLTLQRLNVDIFNRLARFQKYIVTWPEVGFGGASICD